MQPLSDNRAFEQVTESDGYVFAVHFDVRLRDCSGKMGGFGSITSVDEVEEGAGSGVGIWLG